MIAGQSLTYTQLITCISLVGLMALMSVVMRAQLERSILVASARMILQLSVVGFVLKQVFALNNTALVLLIGVFMIMVAIHANGQRVKHRPRSFWWSSSLSIFLCVTLSMAFAALVFPTTGSPFEPRFFIPILGILIGNTLTGVSLGLDNIVGSIKTHRLEIESLMALGATPFEAGQKHLREAYRRSLTPILNGMTITGLVSLPGVMTGQILTGQDPAAAASFQMAIMCLLSFSTFLGSILSVNLIYSRQFNRSQQWIL